MNQREFKALRDNLYEGRGYKIRPGWNTEKTRLNGAKAFRSETLKGGEYTVRPFRFDGANKYNPEGIMHRPGDADKMHKHTPPVYREALSRKERLSSGGIQRTGYGSIKID